MHRRFARAQTISINCPERSISAFVADGFRMRLLGLMRLGAAEVEPLLFERCRSIHTFGMKTPIDLVWLGLDGWEGHVLAMAERLDPNRKARAPGGRPRRRTAALELAPGEAARLGLGAGAQVSVG